MKIVLAAILVAAFLEHHFVFCGTCSLIVKKTLENGEILPDFKWTTVEAHFPQTGNPVVTVRSRYRNNQIQVFFANEIKNVLALNLTGSSNVVGHRYETPHGHFNSFIGPQSTVSKEEIKADIPLKWFPPNITRMSASVNVKNHIYNYYGIFNYKISIPDTMLVEEFKRIEHCVNEENDGD